MSASSAATGLDKTARQSKQISLVGFLSVSHDAVVEPAFFHGGRFRFATLLLCRIGMTIWRPASNTGSIGTDGFAITIGE
jgi:hypothetical protein